MTLPASPPSHLLLSLQHFPSENGTPIPAPLNSITLTPPEPCSHPTNSSLDCDRCGFKSSHQRHQQSRHKRSSRSGAEHVIVGRCPHCAKKYKMRINELALSSASAGSGGLNGEGHGVYGNEAAAKSCRSIASTDSRGEGAGADPVVKLRATFLELQETLGRHGNALRKIDLYGGGSVGGESALAPLRIKGQEGRRGSGLPTPPMETGDDQDEDEHEGGFYDGNRRVGGVKDGETVGLATYQMLQEYSDDMEASDTDEDSDSPPSPIHNLIQDPSSLLHLTSAVARLLKTLHDKVTQLDKESDALRTERQEVKRVMQRNQRVAEDLEKERLENEMVRLNLKREKKALVGEGQRRRAKSEVQSQVSPSPPRTATTVGTGQMPRCGILKNYSTNDLPQTSSSSTATSIPTPPTFASPNSSSSSALTSAADREKEAIKRKASQSGLSFTSIVGPKGDVLWSPEKEQLLRSLQAKLKEANANWSPEAEEYYERVEHLLEERYKAKKLARIMSEDSHTNKLATHTPTPIPPQKDSQASLGRLNPTSTTNNKSTTSLPTATPATTTVVTSKGTPPRAPSRRRNTAPEDRKPGKEEVRRFRRLFGVGGSGKKGHDRRGSE